MIVQLQPEQIAAYWPAIKHGIAVAAKYAGTDVQRVSNDMLAQLLSGKGQCWIGIDDRDEGMKFSCFGLTSIVRDSGFAAPYLFLHTLYAYRTIPETILRNIVPTLEAFARANDCTSLITFTNIDRVQQLYEASGFTSDWKMYIKPL